jgi:hypothetical protein
MSVSNHHITAAVLLAAVFKSLQTFGETVEAARVPNVLCYPRHIFGFLPLHYTYLFTNVDGHKPFLQKYFKLPLGHI